MNRIWKDIMAGLVMGMIVPGIVLNYAAAQLQPETEEIAVAAAAMAPESPEETQSIENKLKVRLRNQSAEVIQWEMDAYLVGVVLAEMPAGFETEALKAQAVVARTYALKAYTTGGKHGDGSVCTQSGCCQAYISEENYLKNRGTPKDVEKVRSAVLETSGYVLMYGGELIEATYFSCSGGQTEDAVAVWGTDFPYLRSVASPGEENAAYYTGTTQMEGKEFCRLLGISPQGSPNDWIEDITYTSGGGIDEAVIGGKVFSGVQLRQLLGLRSTAVSMQVQGQTIVLTTKGYGHRVGMSQYGADAMAASGSNWRQILAHYYSGTEAVMWKAESI